MFARVKPFTHHILYAWQGNHGLPKKKWPHLYLYTIIKQIVKCARDDHKRIAMQISQQYYTVITPRLSQGQGSQG